jgi:hypothetical protein
METFVNSMQKAIDSRDGALVASLASSIKGPSATLGSDLSSPRLATIFFPSLRLKTGLKFVLKYLKLKTVYLRSQEQLRKLCPDVFAEGAPLIG